ncbi:MAG: hypothetical protein JWP12_114 [Bacteroidetes bacterium]|nr:hypothetical protein [Bacteroidota bacterium]
MLINLAYRYFRYAAFRIVSGMGINLTKKMLLSIFLFLLSMVLSGQTAVDSIKVKKVKWAVTIKSDSVFWIGKANPVTIDVKGGMNYAVNIKGGTISKKPGGYVAYAQEEGAVTVAVYEKLPKNKMRVLATKLIPVKRIPVPQIFICGVQADSVIDKEQIIQDNVVTAYHPYYKVALPVVGFDMVLPMGTDSAKLTSPNNHFTIEMRKHIYGIKSGTLIYFENVYYLLPDGSKEKIDAFGVYITETNKYKVGYRIRGL